MDTVIRRNPTTQLRERIEAILTENIVWSGDATPERIIDLLVAAVGETTAKQVLVITCSKHGEIAREDVWCEHDTEEVLRRVATAHGASYGGNCKKATLNVEITEP